MAFIYQRGEFTVPEKYQGKDKISADQLTNSWQVFAERIGGPTGKKFYFFVAPYTSLLVITSKIDPDQFRATLSDLIDNFTYLTRMQKTEYVNEYAPGFSFYQEEQFDNKLFLPYLKQLQKPDAQVKFMNELKDDAYLPIEVQMAAVSGLVMSLDKDQLTKLTRKMAHLVNQKWPQKTQFPKKKYKYQDLKARFESFAKWNKYVGLSSTKNEDVVKQIVQNNQKIIDQYLLSAKIDLQTLPFDPDSILEEYLNKFLLKDIIRFATTNLADCNIYFCYLVTQKHLEPKQTKSLLLDFYRFLVRTGMMRKTDLENLSLILWSTDDQMRTTAEPDELIKHFQALKEKGFNVAEVMADVGMKPNEIDAVLRTLNSLPENQIKLENQKRNQAVYEIRAKLLDFRPIAWRRFWINGDNSIELLMQAVITMFNGFLEHMYDLRFPSGDQHFENETFMESDDWDPDSAFDSQKAKVSMLEEKQKAVITYDYGDYWQFEIKVRKVMFDQHKIKAPKILSGKGYGIIEDIGGTWAMSDYNNDRQHNDIDPDLLEWMGGKPIDLDHFDKDSLNQNLMDLPIKIQ